MSPVYSVTYVSGLYQLPSNKRLKLSAPGLGKNCVCAPAGSVVVSIDVAPRGSAPQLKRIPLGAITATSDMIDRDSPVSNAAARIAGAALIIAALAAGYGLVTYVPGPDVR